MKITRDQVFFPNIEDRSARIFLPCGILYDVDIKTGFSKEVLRLDRSILPFSEPHSIIQFKRKIILIPRWRYGFILYDSESDKTEFVPIAPSAYRFGNYASNFYYGSVYRNKLYLWGVGYAGIFQYDFDTGVQKNINEWVPGIWEKCIGRPEGGLLSDIRIDDELVALPFLSVNAVLLFNRDDSTYSIEYIPEESAGFFSGVYFNGDLLLTPRDSQSGKIIRWTMNTHDYTIINYPNEMSKHMTKIGKTFLVGDTVYSVLAGGRSVLIINLKENHTEISPLFDAYINEAELEKTRDEWFCCIGDEILLFSSNCIYKYNTEQRTVSITSYLTEETMTKFREQSVLKEQNNLGLREMLGCLIV